MAEKSLQGRVAVITGATGGLGSVVSRALADEGASLALFSTNEEHLAKLAEKLGLPGDRVVWGAFDFSTAEGAKGAADKVQEKYGKVDIVAHLVGGWTGGKSIVETPVDEFTSMLNQHAYTTYHIAQSFVPALIDNGWGRFIVVSSPHAATPPANMGAYAAAKAAQEALVMTIAKEAVAAGSALTANVLHVRTIDAKHERDREPSSKNASWTTPEEITAALLYLCSEGAHVVNGARIPLYSGR